MALFCYFYIPFCELTFSQLQNKNFEFSFNIIKLNIKSLLEMREY